MDYRSVIEAKINRSKRISNQLNNINNIFLGIVAIEFIVVFLILRQVNGILSFLLIPGGIFLLGLTYLSYLMIGAFIALLEQTTIHNTLLIESEENRKNQHNNIIKMKEAELKYANPEEIVHDEKLKTLKKIVSTSNSSTTMIVDDEEITYTDLINNLAELKHTSIRTKAKVLQKMDINHYQVAANEEGTDDLLVINNTTGYDINVEDWIDINGIVKTQNTYITTVGSRVTVPVIELK